MKSKKFDAEEIKVSFIEEFLDIKWWEHLLSFAFSSCYPMIIWIAFKINRARKPAQRIIFIVLGMAVTCINWSYGIEPFLKILMPKDPSLIVGFGSYGIEPFLKIHMPKDPAPIVGFEKFCITIIITLLLNLFLYFLLFLFNFHHLLYNKTYNAGRDVVSKWSSGILGHKLWSGPNTYKLLEHLLKESSDLGRAKWLLVNFLSEDIEKKIHELKPKQENIENGKIQPSPNKNEPVYEITVRDWSIYTYSSFLANNMSHARKSINWVVDPIDLITQIIPAHVIEVIISIGSLIDPVDIKKTLDLAKKAIDKKDERGKYWGVVLGNYADYCPIYLRNQEYKKAGQKEYQDCNKNHNNCPYDFPFKNEPANHHRQLEFLWYALFAGSLKKLQTAGVENNEIIRISDTIPIKYGDVKKKYQEREAMGSLVLPHIDEFRKASCSKKRHVYLGIMPKSSKETKISKGIANLREYISGSNANYIQSIVPKFELSNASIENSLFSSLLKHNYDIENKKIYWDMQVDVDCFWEKIPNDVKKLVLQWALKLFSYTSGGPNLIKGVFVDRRLEDLTYPDCHDIGFYDELLVLSSERGPSRNVTWRVYQDVTDLEKTYFTEDSDFIVDFKDLEIIIMDVLGENEKPR